MKQLCYWTQSRTYSCRPAVSKDRRYALTVFEESIWAVVLYLVQVPLLYSTCHSSEVVVELYVHLLPKSGTVYRHSFVYTMLRRSNFDGEREGRRQMRVERILSGIKLKFPS